jgi:DNA-binding response OmpR family regulator
LDTLAAFLEDQGFEVLTAARGDEALEILRRIPVDIAIVDMRLRKYDGNTLMMAARRVQRGVKFLVHTGSSRYIPPPEIAALGIRQEDVFMKPVRRLNTLCTAIDRHMR